MSLCGDEEDFYRYKSRVKWLQKGDKNTAYFFRKMHGHRAKNKIMSIATSEWQVVHGEENVHQEAIHFFSNFLGVQQRNVRSYNRVAEVITAGLTIEQQTYLSK